MPQDTMAADRQALPDRDRKNHRLMNTHTSTADKPFSPMVRAFRLLALFVFAAWAHPSLAPAAGQAAAQPDARLLNARLDSAHKRLEKRFAFLTSDGRRKKLTELYQNYKEHREKAWAYLFDKKTYPTPAKARTGWTPGRDTQPGHGEMEARVSATIAAHNHLIMVLNSNMGLRSASVGLPRPTAKAFDAKSAPKVPAYGFYSQTRGIDAFLKNFKRDYDRFVEARVKWQSTNGAAESTCPLSWKRSGFWPRSSTTRPRPGPSRSPASRRKCSGISVLTTRRRGIRKTPPATTSTKWPPSN